jgi:hypothetical protein
MALSITSIVALAWCAWLLYDGIQECRKIDRERSARSTRSVSLANCLEVR